jgi:hypothetical protein
MAGIACAVDNGETVQLVTGHTPEDSWHEYEHDPLFAATVHALAYLRGETQLFILAPTEHVYEIQREYVLGPNY